MFYKTMVQCGGVGGVWVGLCLGVYLNNQPDIKGSVLGGRERTTKERGRERENMNETVVTSGLMMPGSWLMKRPDARLLLGGGRKIANR